VRAARARPAVVAAAVVRVAAARALLPVRPPGHRPVPVPRVHRQLAVAAQAVADVAAVALRR